MPKYAPLDKETLRHRIKEIEARIKQMDRREKALSDLKKWLANRKLDVSDLGWMAKQMRPRRAAKAVKSKKPLQAERQVGTGLFTHNGKLVPLRGDPAFRAAIRKARKDRNLNTDALGKKIGVSGASINNWEQGRNVPNDGPRLKVLKVLDLPLHLGAEASKAMEQQVRPAADGRA
jgi:DNA-binding transcriptional regulator YiaG